MAQDVIDLIRARQNLMLVPKSDEPPVHKPQILLIGCVDARLSIHKDLGFPDGSALIFRNIAALVSGNTEGDESEHVSEAAVLQFAVDVMKVKHIVVMGHTDCGGIKACLAGGDNEQIRAILNYLQPLSEVREEVIAQGGDEKAQARAMEKAAVRNSVINLLTYPVVARAVKEGRIDIHGWVINTGTKVISEMDQDTGEFHSMRKGDGETAQKTGSGGKGGRGFINRFLSSLTCLPVLTCLPM